jgi:hypothetical protein
MARLGPDRGFGLTGVKPKNPLLSPAQRMLLQPRHLFRKRLPSGLLYPVNTRLPVGAKNQREDFRHDVVEFLALIDIGKRRTLGATLPAMFGVALPDGTPGGLLILCAPAALPAKVLPAGAAVKTAIGDHGLVGYHFFHTVLLLVDVEVTK